VAPSAVRAVRALRRCRLGRAPSGSCAVWVVRRSSRPPS